MTNQKQPRSVCKTSGLPLFARLDINGDVLGVENCAIDVERGEAPSLEPDPRGNRLLPLYGEDTQYDLATEVRQGPYFTVEADRVMRSWIVRPKLASELLAEIASWRSATAGAPQ